MGALALLASCATAPPAGSPGEGLSSDVDREPDGEAAATDDPCVSTVLCVDRAEAKADVDPRIAEADLERCLACPDASAAGYRLLADLARGRGDRAKARRVLTAGARRHPDSASIALGLARIERDEGRIQHALAAFERAARAHPRDEVIAREYEAMLARHGTEAQRREVELRPLLREAAGRFELGDVDGARQTLILAHSRAEGLAAFRSEIDHRLALIELSEGRYAVAERYVTAALKRAPADALRLDLLLTLGELRMADGRWGPALQVNRRAIALDDESPLAWANTALSLAALGDLDAAIDAFSTAVDCGLSRRLTFAQLTELGYPFDRLRADARFAAIADRGWPGRAEAEAQTK